MTGACARSTMPRPSSRENSSSLTRTKPSQFLWPPPQPNLALQMIAAIRPDPFIISEAAKGTYIKERDRRMLEDNRRQIAEAEQRQREFEKQKAAEAEAAKERDR